MIGAHSFDHDHNLVVPYNMEYALPSHNYHTTAELNGSDLFSMQLPQAATDQLSQFAAQPNAAASGLAESVAAESQVNPVVASYQTAQNKASQITQPIIGQPTVSKVKRQDDIWTGKMQRIPRKK